jgi:type IV pilus assembly protein PilC
MRVESSWCRLIAQWVEAGLDWDQALTMASAAVDSPVMVQAGAAIRQRLASGQSLGQALAACPHPDGRRALFSPMLTQWVQAGEATGTVCPLLRQWARLQHERLSEQWQLACRLLEPTLMGLLGVLMGWLVLALYVPVLQLGHLM